MPVSEDAVAPLSGQPLPSIRGLVDNATAERGLYGWVWDMAYPEERVTVELRLSGAMVARAVADLARPDLVKAGVGDGCHAFEFDLTPEWLGRQTELTVVAIGVDGRDYPIVMGFRRSELRGEEVPSAQRTSEALMAAQRELTGEVQAVALRLAKLPEIGQVQQVLAQQETLQQQLNQLVVWLMRLDAHLVRAAEASSPKPQRAFVPWQIVLLVILAASVAAVTAGSALWWLGTCQ